MDSTTNPLDAPPRATYPFHPFVVAVFPAVAVFAQNFGSASWLEMLVACGVSACICGLLFVLFGWLYAERNRAALAASWCMALVSGFGFVHHVNGFLATSETLWRIPLWGLFGLWCVVLLVGLNALRRSLFESEKITKLANMFCMMLMAGPLLTMTAHAVQSPTEIAAPPQVASMDDLQLQLPKDPPDVYYLVFDRYGDETTLRDDYGFDNRPFLNSLRDRGFVVAEQSRSNYPKTDLSMASAFNMQYHGDKLEAKNHYMGMLRDSIVVREMTQAGYAFHHYGVMLDGLRASPHATNRYRVSPMPSEYTDILMQFSVFEPLFRSTTHRDETLEKFERLLTIAQEPGPKFVYMHFLAPHSPWSFNADGSQPCRTQLTTRTRRENYVQQLQFTNDRIERAVDAILAKSQTPPIIILQADEGPELSYDGDAEKPLLAQVEKRTGILTAFCLPNKKNAAEIVPPTISPVNTFRFVFREYFGADIDLLPDRVCYWKKKNPLGRPHFGEPCEFVDYTKRLQAEYSASR